MISGGTPPVAKETNRAMRWVGHHAWLTTALLSLGIPLATFIIFERWFLVPMPKGPLEAWLGF